MIAKTELEVRLLSVLKRIAHYQTAEQILRSGEKQYGIPGSEALEYAYENIQSEAKHAIKNVRLAPRSKDTPHA